MKSIVGKLNLQYYLHGSPLNEGGGGGGHVFHISVYLCVGSMILVCVYRLL